MSSVYRNILVAVDGSPDGEAALMHAGALARDQRARLTLLTAIPPVPATALLATGAAPPRSEVVSHYDELLRQAAATPARGRQRHHAAGRGPTGQGPDRAVALGRLRPDRHGLARPRPAAHDAARLRVPEGPALQPDPGAADARPGARTGSGGRAAARDVARRAAFDELTASGSPRGRQGHRFAARFARPFGLPIDCRDSIRLLAGQGRSARGALRGRATRHKRPRRAVSITFGLFELARWWGVSLTRRARVATHPVVPRPFRPPNRSEVARRWRAHRRSRARCDVSRPRPGGSSAPTRNEPTTRGGRA